MVTDLALTLLGALLFGYLLGSIPFGLVLTRVAGLGDVRNIGSGNIGATNVLRTGNKGLAAATLLLDALKGTAAVLIASTYGIELGLIAGLGAFLGHLFPVWLLFKGGKGVATYIGVLLGIAFLPLLWAWVPVLVFAGVWLAAAIILRYSSLSALLAAIITPAVTWTVGLGDIAAGLAFMSLLLILKHHANIRRLLSGNESKIGAKG
ncbi:MAG: glycerol-3-phosphate 1-O-acyltransferase PlsY [Rhizobiaceae bacterium]|nr:glycerol-3-phosphate 1-O-acyltransferase PlsY [Rhizobiaceae bacterium]